VEEEKGVGRQLKGEEGEKGETPSPKILKNTLRLKKSARIR